VWFSFRKGCAVVIDMLYLIGLGLGDEKDITVRGLEIVKKCSAVFLEYYTSVLGADVKKLVGFPSSLINQT
jgi:diphthamide biosynthesis methyltransferase